MINKVKTWFDTPTKGAAVIIAIATVVNLLVSAGLWIATRDSVNIARSVFEGANRPYIGIENIVISPFIEQGVGKNIQFIIIWKNFGTATAEEAKVNWKVLINGIQQPTIKVPDRPSSLFPSATVHLRGSVGNENADPILKGKMILQIILSASYSGPSNNKYTYCEKTQYNHLTGTFINLGRCEEEYPKR
jgi:hypothetical protein